MRATSRSTACFLTRSKKRCSISSAVRSDWHAKVIRAIGQPLARFGEDKLRLLRAVRFAVRFGFSIEPETAQSDRANGRSDRRGQRRTDRQRAAIDPAAICAGRKESNFSTTSTCSPPRCRPWPPPKPWPSEVIAAIATIGPSRSRFSLSSHEPSFPLALAALVHRLLPPGEVAKLGLKLKLPTAEIDARQPNRDSIRKAARRSDVALAPAPAFVGG